MKKQSASAGKLDQKIILFAVCAVTALVAPAPAATYYIATNGSDSNPGTSTNQPFATLAHAVSAMAGGDVTYMRGGTYATSSQISMTKIGSSAGRYTITNYPGEVPILNCSGESGSSEGIRITGAYWQLYGLVISNAAHNGINIRGGTTALMGSFNHIERCVVIGNRDSGMLIGSDSGTFTALPGSNLVLNCDATRNFDSPAGGNADGFSAKWAVGAGNEFRGCRSWENSDDGWDLWMATNSVLISDCWAFRNGSNVWASAGFAGNGNGFKLGGNFIAASNTLVRGLAYQNVNNGSGGNGVDQNNNTGNLTIDQVTSWANGGANFALNHNSGHGNQSHVVRNCISMAPGTNSDAFTSNTTRLSNSWQVVTSPFVNSNDFVSVDASQLIASRQADGSLPVITFVNPVPAGRLVDKGVIIPGESYNGSAPDLGAFETSGGIAPTASFTGSPTSGTAPLAVTFTDSSTGDITNRFWNFGDSVTSNTTATTMNHTYAAGTYNVTLTVSGLGGSNTSTQSNYIVAVNPPVARFTASPISGTEPLTVMFTDVSTGSSPLSLSWDFGDSTTTNTSGGASFGHSYVAGTYTVTLTASNQAGTSTFISNNVIQVVTGFQAWQQQYFSCTNCAQAAANSDPDGDGQNNAAEFLSGTDPSNNLSVLRIISTAVENDDVRITWTTAGGHTNAVQVLSGDMDGDYSSGYTDLSGPMIITGSGDSTTNYLDVGGATNNPARYYRIRLVP